MLITLYSITDKQKFIFSSPKLKENIGASVLIDAVFSLFMPEEIENLSGQYKTFNLPKSTNEKDLPPDLFDKNGNFTDLYDLGLLTYGGGNALMLFRNRKIFREFNKLFTYRIFKETNGFINLTFASKEYETSKSYRQNYNELVEKLSFVKKSSTPLYPQIGMGITQFSTHDGMPITRKNDDVSVTASKKIEAFNKEKFLKNYFGEIYTQLDIKNTKNFDEIAEEDNRLGVIHIDGNSMGKQIKEMISGNTANHQQITSPKEAILMINELSREITATYRRVFLKIAHIVEKKIRPIVLAGDDVCYVIKGKHALYSAKIFLEELKKEGYINLKYSKRPFRLSACAGVAIVNKHYPFYRAYTIAEELCDTAKKRAKEIAKERNSYPGNWIDFQLLITSYIRDLDSIRKQFYEISHSHDYKLYMRPYCIDSEEKIFSFETFEYIYKEFSEKKWPKSKVKQLRNLFIERPVKLKDFLNQCKTRDLDLPLQEKFKDGFVGYKKEKISPYFDVVEMLGYYEKP